jgi:hypothetical protein
MGYAAKEWGFDPPRRWAAAAVFGDDLAELDFDVGDG